MDECDLYSHSCSLQQALERVLGPEPGAAVLAGLLDDPQGVPWRALASGTPKVLTEAIRYPCPAL